ncbi:urease accessory protein UreD [Streptomyces sp. P9-2B-2]|uniref:urease accessory protein UreD n=1 Tax=Streptomyces sp. P9-2B-2 TaxID=3057114 RepID=UPI0025B5F5D7|nr:urease accessory protein UreD [Streptomyces sp. P9-2B-2]WJY41570.1 urease accessory protein UreD [Streptomyces sp. P9-2B-2]
MTTIDAAPVPGVHSTAHIVAVPDPRGGTALPVLRGRRALVPRHMRTAGPFARVVLTGSMRAPHGGDQLRLRAEVRTGAQLSLGTVGATLALPGPRGGTATSDVLLRVEDGAELHYLPEPLISAAHSDLETTTRVELAPEARLVLKEEQVLGRTNEPSGRLRTRLTVRLAGKPLLDQELAVGPGVPSWSGPAVLADYRMTGQLLIVSPEFTHQQPPPQLLPTDPGEEGEAALTPLAGPAVLITAAAANHATLRQLLDRGHEVITP